MSRMTVKLGLAVLTAAALSVSSSLPAQSLTTPAATSSASVAPSVDVGSPVGPRVTSVGIKRADVASGNMMALQSSPARRDVAWMVLGGAALVVGSIVGGDGGTIIMVTGGVIGLVGLWRYLQYS